METKVNELQLKANDWYAKLDTSFNFIMYFFLMQIFGIIIEMNEGQPFFMICGVLGTVVFIIAFIISLFAYTHFSTKYKEEMLKLPNEEILKLPNEAVKLYND